MLLALTDMAVDAFWLVSPFRNKEELYSVLLKSDNWVYSEKILKISQMFTLIFL